jgi:hypothetical protein
LTLKEESDILKSNSNILTGLENFWNQAPFSILTSIQAEGQCCGFMNYSDRVIEPCQRFQQQVGCRDAMKEQYIFYLKFANPFTISIICFGGITLILSIAKIIKRSKGIEYNLRKYQFLQNELKNEKAKLIAKSSMGKNFASKKDGEGLGNASNGIGFKKIFKFKGNEPFDEWHKAVFS